MSQETMSPLSNKELEERLSCAGNSLLQPPSSLNELLTLLDRIEELLSKVEQSPTKSMQAALSPLMKALISDELLKHSDVDVKVGVASCISEITRITAPDAPYEDDKMKDVFQLIVLSFENLSETSSRSHEKRVTILETMAKVRSCVIMLDLQWDHMIIEMFQHFLKSIRVYHAEVIFASMETIMTLVLEESEDVSPDLLNPILDALKRNNEVVLPIAKKLAEKVIQNCMDKLRPCLIQAVNTLDAVLDDYSEVVASICQKNAGTSGHSDENISKGQLVDERKSTSASPVRPAVTQTAKDCKEEINLQSKDPPLNISPRSIVSDSTGAEETVTDANYLKRADSNQQFDAKSTSNTESDDLGALKPTQSEAILEHVAYREGRQLGSKHNLAESSDLLDDEKQAEQVPCHQETPGNKIHSSPCGVPPVEAAMPFDKVKDTTTLLSPSKASQSEVVKVASPTQSSSLPDEDRFKWPSRAKGKDNLVKEETASVDIASKKASEGANISEVKKQRNTVKKQHDEIANDKVLNDGLPKNNSGGTSDKTEDGSSLKEDGRRGGRVKPRFEKDTSKYSAREDHGKEMVASPTSPLKSTKDEVNQDKTPRISTKRKRTPGTENTSESIQYGENLVGSKVKVWWPKDRMFYEGVIASFDSVNKKHKVLYDDGDKEVLNLRRERWEFVGDNSVSDGGLSVAQPSHDASSNIQKKKRGKPSSRHGKMEGLPRSKLKDNLTKYAGKSKDYSKAEPKCKDSSSESSGNSEDESNRSEDHSQKLERTSPEKSAKPSGRSQDVDVARNSRHSKQDIRRAAKSKGKNPRSGKSLSLNGTGMKKSSSSKVKEIIKGAKSRESGSKSGKKRR